MKAIAIDLEPSDKVMEVAVRDADRFEMSVTSHQFRPARPVQPFMIDGNDHFKVNIYMEAAREHEEERATDPVQHEMTQGSPSRHPTRIFREQWLRGGLQTFEEMERIWLRPRPNHVISTRPPAGRPAHPRVSALRRYVGSVEHHHRIRRRRAPSHALPSRLVVPRR
jgi:hypothetical protein